MLVWSIKGQTTVLTKIATCNYCGTRAALVLQGNDRHELACSACGAPLHDLKHMPVHRAESERHLKHDLRGKKPKKPKRAKKSKYKKKKKSFLFEAFDLIEDIFDKSVSRLT